MYQLHLKIIGCTLWSNIDINIAHYMNDYYKIYTTSNTLLTSLVSKIIFESSKNIL